VYVPNDTSAFVGIGDWNKASVLAGSTIDPDERLDVLDRTIRIRDFADPNRDYERPLLERFLVADPADGRVYWRDVDPTPPSGVDCSWTLQGPAGSNSNIATAYANNPGCPQADRRIGIGVQSPSHKLHVEHNADPIVGGAIGGGVRSDLKGVDGGNYSGMWSKVAPVGTGSLGTATGSFNEVYKPRTSGTGSLNYVYLTDTEASNVKGYGSIGLVFPNSGVVSEARGLVGEVNRSTSANVSIAVGVHANSHGGGTVTHNRGVEARAHTSGSTASNVGGHITSNIGITGSATTSYGVYAESGGTGTITNNFGVYAQSIGGTTNHGIKAYCAGGTQNYGVWAQVNDTSTNTWAGYFQGKVKVTGNMWHNNTYIFSDMGLKADLTTLTDNDPFDDLVSGLSSLNPRVYNYTDDAKDRLLINGGQQLGFYAQEVAEVYPQLVSETTLPALVDTAGNVLWEPLTVKGVNYVGLIPVLVAAHNRQEQALVDQEVANSELLDQVQAQHDVITQLSETVGQLLSRVDQMEQLLALCCQAPTDSEPRNMGVEDTGSTNPADDRILRIQPNPFNERTTLYYKLERTGRMQLMANSSDGKQLRVLQEAQLEQGEYQYEWQTADLAPGIYYVTLLLDGEPVVKKAVKVN
jgi:hypothetical protein